MLIVSKFINSSVVQRKYKGKGVQGMIEFVPFFCYIPLVLFISLHNYLVAASGKILHLKRYHKIFRSYYVLILLSKYFVFILW